MKLKSIILAATCATVARAHGTVSGFVTDSTWNQGFLLDYYYLVQNGGTLPDISAWYAEDLDNGFVEPNNYGTSDINCHKNAKPGSATTSVAAGGTVEFQWTTWPHDTGPVLTYVAECSGDCAAADKTTLEWVKIDEAGWDTSTGWASAQLIENNSTWTTTVPSTLAAGNYIFRHESTQIYLFKSLLLYLRPIGRLNTAFVHLHILFISNPCQRILTLSFFLVIALHGGGSLSKWSRDLSLLIGWGRMLEFLTWEFAQCLGVLDCFIMQTISLLITN